jgi:ATP-dependent DNA ligase
MSARFIQPMECLSTKKLPTGGKWTYEIKLDGFRVEAVRTRDQVILYSRRGVRRNAARQTGKESDQGELGISSTITVHLAAVSQAACR